MSRGRRRLTTSEPPRQGRHRAQEQEISPDLTVTSTTGENWPLSGQSQQDPPFALFSYRSVVMTAVMDWEAH